MISGGSQRRAGASGPPNVTLDAPGGNPKASSNGIQTITAAYILAITSGGWQIDISAASSTVLTIDASVSLFIPLIAGVGPISFTGTFSGLQLNFSNCTQLPTMPNGCVSYHALGTTSTTTLVSSTVLPHDIALGELTSRITAVDFSAGSSIESPDTISWDLDTQALDVSSINAILAFCVAHGGDNGSLDTHGGTSAAPSGQGILDVATLIGRGWTVTTN